jgi:putative ABC transport system ATP-binding protein
MFDRRKSSHRGPLVIRDLTVAYATAAQTVRPFEGFDLVVEPGELVLLHGPSGCGKTTLLSAIAGLLQPERGSIEFAGEDVARLDGRAMLRHRRHRIGMVFQSFNLIASLTALENVAVPLRVAGVDAGAARATARHLLTRLGMGHRLDHRPGALSGGQQQRVAIARALANDPPIVLADEPTAHLDHSQIDVVRSTLRAIADSGRIVMISTHDDRLCEVADRVVRMDAASAPAAGVAPEQRTGAAPLRRSPAGADGR